MTPRRAGSAVAPIRALPAPDLAGAPAALPVRADCSRYAAQAIGEFGILRGLVLARLAPAALQPLQPRGLRPGRGAAPLPPSRPSEPSVTPRAVLANILQPLIDVFDAILVFFHDNVGLSWGTVDHRPDRRACGCDPAAGAQPVPLHAGPAEARPGDEEAAGEVQGRQAAAQPGDDEVLPGEQGEPVRVLPAAGAADAGLHLAVLHAAQRTCGSTSAARRRVPCGQMSIRRLGRRGSSSPTSPQGDRRGPGHAARPLRRLAAAVERADVRDGGPQPADADIALPFLFVPFIIGFPAGLLLYWITTNIWTVGQQTVIRKRAGMPVGFRSQPARPGTGHVDRRRRRNRPGAAAETASLPRRTTRGRDGEGRRGRAGGGPTRRQAAPPPPPRRKKKQRSGRRR